ncbi:class I SAM-dependent methyltransferase [Albimonas pacifica]|uniref:Methyltransferase domain-containing protein n=1 Tax=Albimonas pacifica TaxID=1114924 RepID=A0A1I3KTM7_9RHOB|nr:class I SAM-dependent methyltransferase [Albimonas pacifica]SFI75843.1 Methyltransferase domain-containing protein [Albimonas pacifica]
MAPADPFPLAPGAFDEDLAAIHAQALAPRLDPGLPWLIAMGRAAAVGAGRNPSLHDLGCGDGRWMAAAQAAQFRVTGLDLSPACTALARARGLRPATMDAARAPMPAVDLVTALGWALAYLDAAGRPALDTVARRAGEILRPGAWLIFDLPDPAVLPPDDAAEGPGWRYAARSLRIGDTLARETETERLVDGRPRLRRARRLLAAPAPEAVLALLERAGFEARPLDRWGDHPLPAGSVGYAARRKG